MATLVGGSGESLPSLSHSGPCSGWCRLSTGVNSSTWGAYRAARLPCPRPPGHSPGWQAPTQARGVSLPSGCPCLCLSCVVASFSHCAIVTIAPPSPAHHPFSLCLSKKKKCPLRPWPNPGQSWVAFGICRCDWTGQRATVAASTKTEKSWWFCMFELMKYKLCIL